MDYSFKPTGRWIGVFLLSIAAAVAVIRPLLGFELTLLGLKQAPGTITTQPGPAALARVEALREEAPIAAPAQTERMLTLAPAGPEPGSIVVGDLMAPPYEDKWMRDIAREAALAMKPLDAPDQSAQPMDAVSAEAAFASASPRQGASAPVNDDAKVLRYPRLAACPGCFDPLPRLAHGAAPSSKPAPVLPRIEGKWKEGRGLRFRVAYLDAVGFSAADEHGIQYSLNGKRAHNPSEVVPKGYWGTYAVYTHGQRVDYRIEIENTGDAPIRDLSVMAAQEVFNREGGPGLRLPSEVGRANAAQLGPGERLVVSNHFVVDSDWRYDGSLEQTHVLVTGALGNEASRGILAEAYQGGIIDPPPDL
jgi:hypothetical protein